MHSRFPVATLAYLGHVELPFQMTTFTKKIPMPSLLIEGTSILMVHIVVSTGQVKNIFLT